MPDSDRNPHAGRPFTDDDAAIAAALEDVSVPALLCSLVHMTGDPSWIRGDLRPHASALNDYQGSHDRGGAWPRRAVGRCPAIVAFRDARVRAPAAAVRRAGPRDDGVPRRAGRSPTTSCRCSSRTSTSTAPTPAPSRGATRSPPTCAPTSHVVVIGCGESGLLAGIRLAQAGLPFTIIEKNGGPGGTWWENRYPGARVDIGSHFYCYSFEPADHWTEYFSQHPELRAYFERVMRRVRARAALPVRHRRSRPPTYDDATGRWAVTVTNARRRHRGARRPRRDQRGRRAQHAAACPTSPAWTTSRAVVPLGALGPLGRPPRHAVRARRRRRERLPDRADHRRRRRAAHRVPAHRAVDVPQPELPPRSVPDGDRWAIRHLPFYGRWFRFLTFYPGAGSRHGPLTHRPRVRRRRARDQRDATARPASCSRSSCAPSSAATRSSRRR